jgi:homogentisate 1,2-dioxygenase
MPTPLLIVDGPEGAPKGLLLRYAIACSRSPYIRDKSLTQRRYIYSLREILRHTTLDMVNHYLHFTSSEITAQHHKYSPIDKLHEENNL